MAGPEPWKNKLFFGDNLKTLRDKVAEGSVDLIYLDPPFNSNATYNVLFAEKSGEKSTAQIQVFDDTWQWGLEAEAEFAQTVRRGGRLADLLASLRAFLGRNNLMAYLVMMAARLIELHRVLSPKGSIYLHCDPTACHYLKLLMDAIFGAQNFRNEIIWKRTTTHSDSKTWSRVADCLLFYTRGPEFTWNTPRNAHAESYIESKYRYDDGDGRKYALDNMTSPNPRPNMMYEWRGFPSPPKGWRYSRETMAQLDQDGRIWYPTGNGGQLDTSRRPRLKRYISEMAGGVMGTIWTDIPAINSQAQERLGYPTQKPEALLERIVSASSNEDDIILDPFCGCGTAISVAERNNRRWIGIDVTHLATTLIKHRLRFAFGQQLAPYTEIGSPTDLGGAQALANLDRYQFEWWALGLVDARPAHDKKKGPDKGVDGHIYFYSDLTGELRKVVVQVKSGHVTRSMIGDLSSARAREKAEMAIFITLEPATRPMREEALAAGFYCAPEHPNDRIPRMQILTIRDLLDGDLPKLPRMAQMDTFKKPPRAQKGKRAEQIGLFEKQRA